MKRITKYRVKVFYVDDTYWSDGSRYTNDVHDFATKKEALMLIEDILNKGYNFTSRYTKKTGCDWPKKDDLNLIKITESYLDF